MNSQFASLPSPANPFAGLLTPDCSVAAHLRLSGRISATVHRPLDRYEQRPLDRAGASRKVAEADAAIDAEPFDFGALD